VPGPLLRVREFASSRFRVIRRGRVAYISVMSSLLETAQALALARKSGEKLDRYPGSQPPDLAAAFDLQAEVTRALGWKRCGWKVGATSALAQTMLRIDGPFAAPLFAERLFASGEHVECAVSSDRILEPEIAFVMRATLAAKGEPYSVAEVLDAVATVHPAIEVVNPRLPLGLKEPIEWTIADGGINDAFVLGPGVAPLLASQYVAVEVRARQNGAEVTSGIGANVLGGPELVLTWLANHLTATERKLEAGDIVTTGLLTNILKGQRGDEVTAEFSGIGRASVRL
jgi:2-keto-4-pentenoate hydratase